MKCLCSVRCAPAVCGRRRRFYSIALTASRGCPAALAVACAAPAVCEAPRCGPAVFCYRAQALARLSGSLKSGALTTPLLLVGKNRSAKLFRARRRRASLGTAGERSEGPRERFVNRASSLSHLRPRQRRPLATAAERPGLPRAVEASRRSSASPGDTPPNTDCSQGHQRLHQEECSGEARGLPPRPHGFTN